MRNRGWIEGPFHVQKRKELGLLYISFTVQGRAGTNLPMKAETFSSVLIFLSKVSISFAKLSSSLGDFFKAAK
jgi:hypothetical protein